MKDPEEKEMMAYIAGLIDGDGHIGMRNRAEGHVPLVQLHNSSRNMPLYLKKTFGGTIAVDEPKKEGNRRVWKWMLQGRHGIKNCLESIRSYLITKQDSADEILEFLNDPIDEKDYYQSCKFLNLNRKLQDANFCDFSRGNFEDSFFWSYVAGLMDTDGSFSIERSVRKPCPGNRQKNDTIKYRPKILLTMVNNRSTRFIAQNCSLGNVYEVKARTALKGKAFRFCISARSDAIEFLKKVIPYLQTKAVQAVKLLNFCRGYTPTNGLSKVPEEEKQWREDCYNEIVRLNNTPS